MSRPSRLLDTHRPPISSGPHVAFLFEELGPVGEVTYLIDHFHLVAQFSQSGDDLRVHGI